VSDVRQFDELAPLHPHVASRPRSVETRAVRADVVRASRRGHATTEFWLVAAAIIGPVALALAGVDRRQIREIAIGGGIAAAGYALGRSYVKGAMVRERTPR
jgi:hypothetical protein